MRSPGDYRAGPPKTKTTRAALLLSMDAASLSPGKQRFPRGRWWGVSAEDNIREKRSVLRARRQPNSVATSFVMLRNELVEKHPFRVQSLNK